MTITWHCRSISLSRLLLRKKLQHAFMLPVVALLAACSTFSNQKISAPATASELAALRSIVALQDRLDRVAAPLLISNPELCKGNARNLFGFTAKNKYSYTPELINASEQALGLGEQLQITGVLSGSGAARVGVRRGDKLVAAEGRPIAPGPNAEQDAAAVLAPLVQDRTKVKLTMLRSGSNLTLNVPLTLACAFSINLGNTSNVMAYADGRRVLITRGMLNFAKSDDELAYVVAKEMAHNALGHPGKQHMGATVSDIIDNLIRIHPDMSTLTGKAGLLPYPQEMDAAADALSLYMLARAGYGIDRTSLFWQKLATQYPASVLNGYTAIHPATAYRVAGMGKTVAEIKAKQATKQALLP